MTSSIEQLSTPFSYKTTIEACPAQFLKTIETLKQMGLLATSFELAFKTISEIELFTRILNREEDQERVANELRLTFFHSIRGKVKRQSMTKNQEFQSMKRMRFNSAYHATLFTKYFQHRIKQLQNEYSYTITSGKDGYLHIYLNHDETISSMFVNEIRDMKKRLNFLEIKDVKLCEKFVYSLELGEQLKKIGILHEIWYRGKQSTMIFYSEKQPRLKMKSLLHTISKYHLTILKMSDDKSPFLFNYLLFSLLKQSFSPQLRQIHSVQPNQVQFNQNKLGIVIHDKHEIFSPQITEEILNKMKSYVLMTLRGKNSRRFYNFLKKTHFFQSAIKFIYSKKTVCLCINVEKLKSLDDLRRMFGNIAEAIDSQSQITFIWFHLQHDTLEEHRKHMMERMVAILSLSGFHVENFEKFIQNRALKCNLKLKNISKDPHALSEYLGDVLTSIVKVWDGKEKMKEEGKLLQKNDKQQQLQSKFTPQENQLYDSQQNDSDNVSDYDLDEQPQLQSQQHPKQVIKSPSQHGLQVQNQFTEQLQKWMMQKQPTFYTSQQSQQQPQWKQGRSWRKAEELLQNEAKIVGRVRHVSMNEELKHKICQVRDELILSENKVAISLHSYESYSLKMFESPFYNSSSQKHITTLQLLQCGQKYVICCERMKEDSVLSYPLCSLQVMRKL